MDDDVLDIEDGTADFDGDHDMAESSTSSTTVVHDTLLPPTPAVPLPPPPSDNELRLGKRVLALEAERDNLNKELSELRNRLLPHAPDIPVPDRPPDRQQLITIPQELLPTLALLRSHIAELTRDNGALRYAFLGAKSGSDLVQQGASSSRMTLDTPMTGLSMEIKGSPEPPSITISDNLQEATESQQGVDLGAVLLRVRELLRENEELGEMVLEAGKGGAEEWQQALEESRTVITSLDADLTHHASIVETLRAELIAYQTRFGPILPKSTPPVKDSDTASTSSLQTDQRGGNRNRDRDRQKGGRDNRGPESRGSERKDDRGKNGQTESRGGKGEERDHRRSDGRKETERTRIREREVQEGKDLVREKAKEREKTREREREAEKAKARDKEREKEKEKEKEKAREKEKVREPRASDAPKEGIKRPGEVSIRGRASLSKEPKDGSGQVNGHGNGRREEDRESKRRR